MSELARDTLNKARTARGLRPQAKRGRRAGLDVNLGRAEMALAYELHQEGVEMALIAENFGVNASWLCTLLNRCKRDGLSWLLKP